MATVIARRARHRWVAPWRDIEPLIDDVANVRAPSTFLIDGNHHARRAALRLEEVFLRQRELDQRASEGALDVRTILGAMPDGLCVVDEGARVRLLNAAVRRMFRINGTHVRDADSDVSRQPRRAGSGGCTAESLKQARHD